MSDNVYAYDHVVIDGQRFPARVEAEVDDNECFACLEKLARGGGPNGYAHTCELGRVAPINTVHRGAVEFSFEREPAGTTSEVGTR